MAFEALGPTFIKFGQLLATRPDLIPKDYVDEFKKLQDQVPPLSFAEVEKVLNHHFGVDLEEIFQEIHPDPLATASIAQVHKATLKGGQKVVIKVQKPGIEDVIREDLGVLQTLAELAYRYIPESRFYNPAGIVAELRRSLELETNFIIEANNIRRFQQNFLNEPNIKIPKVYSDYTGKKVLVMEELLGIPLSHKNALDQEGIDRETVLKRGLRCYLKMVFTDGLFHGDLHAGNLFVLPNNQIGLIDFGLVGRLNRKTQNAIANMLIALAEEDYDRLAFLYVDLAPYAEGVDIDRFARELRDLIAPYLGLTLKHVNVGRMLMDSSAIAGSQGLSVPPELVLFFKSIVTIEGMGRVISKDFDFMAYSLEFASELVQAKYDPTKVAKDVGLVAKDMNSLMQALPRQLKTLLRKLNSPESSMKVSISQLDGFKKSIDHGTRLIFLGLLISGLIMGGSIALMANQSPTLLNMPWVSTVSYGLAAFFTLFALKYR